MSRGDYDDRDDRDRYDDDDRDYRRRDPDEARRKVSAPALMLIITGILGLLLEVLAVVTAFTNPTAVIDFQQQMIDSMPAGAQKDQQQQQLDAQKAQGRLDSPLNLGSYGLGALLNLLTIIGGFKMKGLSGYGLSMTGAISAIVPISGCCCLTTPVGVWALIVLLNPVVKEAFGAGRRAEPQDDFDRRDDRDYDRDDRR